MEMLGTASLAAAIPPERAITTTVRRSEIAAALSDPDGPAELVLDLVLPGDAGGEERSSIGIGWSQEELEGLLGAAPGEDILLAFDRSDLMQAFADVGAHGLRKRALVVAVASVGALGSATAIANAMPVDEGGSVVTPAAVTGTPAVSDATQAGPAAEAAAKAAHGEGLLAAARAATADLSSTAAVATQSGLAAEAAAKAAHGEGLLAAETSASAVPSAAASVATQSDLAAEAAAKAAHGEGLLAAETSGASASSAAASSSTGLLSGVPAPSLSDDLLAGALLLTITGAAFTVRRRTGTMRPS